MFRKIINFFLSCIPPKSTETKCQKPQKSVEKYQRVYSSEDSGANPQNVTKSDDSFSDSLAAGYVLNDGIIGGIIGGDLLGGIVGDALNTTDDSPIPDSSPSYDLSPDCDSGSSNLSYDSGSFDSGFSGGGGDSGDW